MLTLDKLNERETEIKGYLQHAQEQIKQTVTRAEQMRGALECIAMLKKDCEAAEAEARAKREDEPEKADAAPAEPEFKRYSGYDTLQLPASEFTSEERQEMATQARAAEAAELAALDALEAEALRNGSGRG